MFPLILLRICCTPPCCFFSKTHPRYCLVFCVFKLSIIIIDFDHFAINLHLSEAYIQTLPASLVGGRGFEPRSYLSSDLLLIPLVSSKTLHTNNKRAITPHFMIMWVYPDLSNMVEKYVKFIQWISKFGGKDWVENVKISKLCW